jgi:hypothetical protein
MSPDSCDGYEYTTPETELEVTLGGEDFLVVGVATEARWPVSDASRPSGMRTHYEATLDEVWVYPASNDTYSDESLTGAALEAWKSAHGADVIEKILARHAGHGWVASRR